MVSLVHLSNKNEYQTKYLDGKNKFMLATIFCVSWIPANTEENFVYSVLFTSTKSNTETTHN